MSKEPLKTRDPLIGRCIKIVKGIYLETKTQLLISLPLVFIGFFFNPDFSSASGNNIGDLYELLMHASTAFLTILSICCSIMFPEELKQILKEDEDTESKKIFLCGFIGTIASLVMIVVIRIILMPILNNYVLYKKDIDNFLYAILCFLTFYQLSSVVKTITNFEKRKVTNQHMTSTTPNNEV